MAPSAERPSPKSTNRSSNGINNHTGVKPMTLNSLPPSSPPHEPRRKPPPDRKTVAFAVNYEPSLVDRFYPNSHHSGGRTVKLPGALTSPQSSTRKYGRGQRRSGTNGTPIDGASTNSGPPLRPNVIVEEEDSTSHSNSNSTRNGNLGDTNTNGPTVASTISAAAAAASSCSNPNSTRRSSREQKQRLVNMNPVKVRYDMELVPLAERPPTSFWEDLRIWPPRVPKDPNSPRIMPSSPRVEPMLSSSPSSWKPRLLGSPLSTAPIPVPPIKPAPLINSVVWKPDKRKDWENSVSELTAVCTSAALRKHKGPEAKFVPPLSREYIRDRIDIDDPLRGYQLRHATGGWLQGFVLWTNFTTWTHFFTWDSLHPESGLSTSPHPKKDADGSLARELEALPRSGDPSDAGIVFEQVAEIALLGGLGCGELMLRMALEEILKSGKYRYIVLQATSGSRPFYERFGFQRVGAVCRYGTNHKKTTTTTSSSNIAARSSQNSSPRRRRRSSNFTRRTRKPQTKSQPAVVNSAKPTLETPVQGYRHWTHPNESQHSLELHGGPSYMMCLKLPEAPLQGYNLMEALAPCLVDEKPTIGSLGAAATPNPKRRVKRQIISNNNSNIGEQYVDTSTTPPIPNLLSKNRSFGLPFVRVHPVPGGLTPEQQQQLFEIRQRQQLRQQQLKNFQYAPPTSTSNNLVPKFTPHSKTILSAPSMTTPPPSTSESSSAKRRKVSMDNVELGSAASTANGYLHYPVLPPLASPPSNIIPMNPLGRPRAISIATAISAEAKGPNKRTHQQLVAGGTTKNGGRGRTGKKASSMASKKPKVPRSKTASVSAKKSKASGTVASNNTDDPSCRHQQVSPTAGLQQVDRTILIKQKVKSYPRGRPHFYNKVVRPKNGRLNTPGNTASPFYFVLHYNEAQNIIVACPMTPTGVLSGKRQGRPRYQCVLLTTSSNWITSSTQHFEAVPAFMVMKTPLIAQEAWDILGEP